LCAGRTARRAHRVAREGAAGKEGGVLGYRRVLRQGWREEGCIVLQGCRYILVALSPRARDTRHACIVVQAVLEEVKRQAEGANRLHGSVSPVPAQMWQGRAQSRCRCGRGEPSPRADVTRASPVLRRCGGGEPSPSAMWQGEPSPSADVAAVCECAGIALRPRAVAACRAACRADYARAGVHRAVLCHAVLRPTLGSAETPRVRRLCVRAAGASCCRGPVPLPIAATPGPCS
jgi:hypothetical protein